MSDRIDPAARTLSQWLDHQIRLHAKEIELGLDRVRAVWQAMGASAPAARVITVAGTNGKGSSVAFLDGILRAAGYRTGCYTSPHLLRYNERIRLEGRPVTDRELCQAFERIEQARGATPLTFFEFGTLAALWCMARASLDVAILEVGLGGRLDAVNIVDADVALVTGIARDHTDWLGDSLEQIGREKAGIARPGRPLVHASGEMPDSIGEVADAVGARLFRLGVDYDYRTTEDSWEWRMGTRLRAGLPLPTMRGEVQLRNAAGTLTVLAQLPDLAVDQQAVRQGLLQARLPGRFEVRQHICRWILDVAHNPQAADVLAGQLGDLFVPGTRHAVVGMLRDKAIDQVLAKLAPQVDRWHLLDLSEEPRGASARELLEQLPAETRSRAECWGEAEAGLSKLEQGLDPEDQVLVFGSFLTVAQVMRWMGD